MLMESGAQSAMMVGELWMLKYSATCLGTLAVVRYSSKIILVLLRTITLYIGAQAFVNAQLGQGTGSIAIRQVGCTGTENSVFSCSYNTLTLFCSHSEDAGVKCNRGMFTYSLRFEYNTGRIKGI